MAATASSGPFRRVFTSPWFKSAILSSVILFLSSVSAFALFSTRMAYPMGAFEAVQGGLLVKGLSDWETNAQAGFAFYSAYEDGLTIRDRVEFSGLVPGLSFGVDTIFLPDFVETDDAGMPQSVSPFAFTIPVRYDFAIGGGFFAGIEGFAGYESVGTYYKRFLFHGAAQVIYRYHEQISAGIYAGYGDEATFDLEAAVYARMSRLWSMTAAFEIKRGFKTLKAGTKVLLVRTIGLLAGVDYTVEYGGWNLSFGVFLDALPIFESAVDAAVYVAYSGADLFTIGLNFNFPLSIDRTGGTQP